MTTLFGIAFLVAILAWIEIICICTKRRLRTQKRPETCYVVLPILETQQDWKAELHHIVSDLQWQVSLQTADIFLLLPEESAGQSEEIRQYCQKNSKFRCGTVSELQKILAKTCFLAKRDCNSPKKIV